MPINETIGIDFQFNTDNLQRGVQESKSYLNALRKEQVANTSAFGDWKNSIKGVETYLKYQNKALQVNEARVKALTNALEDEKKKTNASAVEIQRITNLLNDAQIEYNRTANNIKVYTDRLSELQDEAKRATEAQAAMTDGLSRGTQIMTTAIGNLAATLGAKAVSKAVDLVKEGAQATVEAAVEYESAFAKVKKTVDATDAELVALSNTLKGLAAQIPHTAAELAEIAAVGGQLGVSVSGLAEFTKTMALLGDATNLTAEEAGTLLAQFANVTKTPENDFGRLGSVIVELGNNTATTEADILNMAQRLAAAGTAAGLTADQIIGISAALSSMGIESEAGASSISKLINRFQVAVSTGDGLEELARISGETADSFSRLFRSDPGAAFETFIKGLAGTSDQVAVLQKDLGITEVRLTNTLQALSGNSDLLSKSLDLASKAWKNNTALTREAAIFYDTTSAKVDRAKGALKSFAGNIGSYVTPFIGEAADKLVEFLAPLEASKTAIETAGAKLSEYGTTAKNTAGNIDEVTAAQRALNAVMLLDTIKEMADQYKTAQKQFNSFETKARGAADMYQSYAAGIINTARANGVMVTSLAELNEAISKQPKILNFKGYLTNPQDTFFMGVDPTDPFINGTIQDRLSKAAKYLKEYREEADSANKSSQNMADSVNYVAQAMLDGLISNTELYVIKNQDFVAAVNARVAALKKQNELESLTAKLSADDYAKQVESATGTRDAILASNFNLETRRAVLENLIQAEKANKSTVDKTSDAYKIAEERISIYSAAIAEIDGQLAATREKTDAVNASLTTLNGTQAATSSITIESLTNSALRIRQLKAERLAYTENSAAADEYRAALDRMIIAEMKNFETMKSTFVSDLQGKVAGLKKSFVQSYGTDEDKTALKLQELNEEYEAVAYTIKDVGDAVKAGILTEDEGSTLIATLEEIQAGLRGVREELTKIEPDTSGIDTAKKTIDALGKSIQTLSGITETWATELATSLQSAAAVLTDTFTDAEATVLDKVAASTDGIGYAFDGIMSAVVKRYESAIEAVKDNTDEINSKAEEDTEAENARNEERLAAIEEEYAAGRLSYESYIKAKEKADKDYAAALEKIEAEKRAAEQQTAAEKNALARKAFEAEKANQIAMVTINSVSAAMKAFSELGWIGGTAVSVALAALAASQIATIAQQQYVPKYARGGVFESPHIGIIGEAGAEAVMPLENNTEWIDILAHKITQAQAGENVYNNTSTDNHAVTVNQQIYAQPQSRREIYLQTRAALLYRR